MKIGIRQVSAVKRRDLSFNMHLIGSHAAARIFHLFPFANFNLSGNGFDYAQYSFSYGFVIRPFRNRTSVHFIDETGIAFGCNDYFALMRRVLDGFVFEKCARRQKDEQQDQRDHHVVVKSGTFVRPEDVAFNRVPHCLPIQSLAGRSQKYEVGSQKYKVRSSSSYFPLCTLYFRLLALLTSPGLTSCFTRSSSPRSSPRPCTALARPVSAHCHLPVDNSRGSPARCDLQLDHCRSACARTPCLFYLPDGSGCSRAAPGRLRSSNRRKSRETTAVRAATLRGRMSSRKKIPYHRWTEQPPDMAIPASATQSPRCALASRVRRKNFPGV